MKYKSKLSKLNYFIPTSNSIGNEKPKVKDSIHADTAEKTFDYGTYYYDKFSIYLLDQKQCKGITSSNEGISLNVENIVFDREELYFIIKIENNSTLDYDLNFLNLSIETRQKGKRKPLQRLTQDPVFRFNLPTKIRENETVRFVYVLSKFSLSNDRRVIFELNEKDGERNIGLKISHRFINNPN